MDEVDKEGKPVAGVEEAKKDVIVGPGYGRRLRVSSKQMIANIRSIQKQYSDR